MTVGDSVGVVVVRLSAGVVVVRPFLSCCDGSRTGNLVFRKSVCSLFKILSIIFIILSLRTLSRHLMSVSIIDGGRWLRMSCSSPYLKRSILRINRFVFWLADSDDIQAPNLMINLSSIKVLDRRGGLCRLEFPHGWFLYLVALMSSFEWGIHFPFQ